MTPDSDLWYVRDGDQVSGPFTAAEVEAKRRSDDLQWFHEVSQDRLIWTSASALTDPVTGESRLGMTAQSSPRGKSGSRRTAVVGVGVVAVLLGLGWFLQDGIPGLGGKSKAAQAILLVLQENDQLAKETVTKAGIKDKPSVYAQAIEEFVSRMSEVSLSDCPADFRVAVRQYLDAWLELREVVRTLPDGFLDGVFVGVLNGFLFGERDGGLARMTGNVKQASQVVKLRFQDVEKIAAAYGVAYP